MSTQDTARLVSELEAMQAETFEIADHGDPHDSIEFAAGCTSTSSTSTTSTSSCSSCSG